MTAQHAARVRRAQPARANDRAGVSAVLRTILFAGTALGALHVESQVSNDDAAEGAADAAQVEQRFDVWEYRVLGAAILPPQAVERALYGHLGPQKTIGDVEVARQALEESYRSAGYSTVFVDIPEQTVDAGIVRLRVTEGKLDRVRVSGARYFSNRQILAALSALEPGEVPQFPQVQRELAALNRQTPDRAVTPVLRAGRYPGTVDVELQVQDDLPFHGGFEVNNRYTADTTELRSTLSLSYNNLWQKAHTASLLYQVAPEEQDEASVASATYVARLEEAETILALYAVDSSSDVATVGTLAVLGQGEIFGIRGIRPFDPLGSYSHNLTLGIDFKDFDENIRLSLEDGLRTAIKYVNWSASYAFAWTLPESSTDVSVGASWGVRGFGNDDLEFELKRFKARANYMYLMGSAQHSRRIFGDSNARFVSRLGWQYANVPLISNEQFTAGGATSVRGYLEAERLGDLGATLSLELHAPSLVNGPRVDDLRFFGFFDTGALRVEEPLPSQEASFRLRSAGAGLRFLGLGGLAAELDWARPLVDGANVVEDEDRVHFRLSYTF
jgi:hemolysin activation/secretion protein